MKYIKSFIVGLALLAVSLLAPSPASADPIIIDPNACVPKLIAPSHKAIIEPGDKLEWSACPDGTGSYEVWTRSFFTGTKSMIRISGTSWNFGQSTMFPGMYRWTIYNCLTMNCYTKSMPAKSQIFYWNPFLD